MTTDPPNPPSDDAGKSPSRGDVRAEPPARTGHVSLEGLHGTVDVPHHQMGFWRQFRAYTGPAILVSVGYMDPGNWGTDLAGGAQYQYDLLWVVLAGERDGHFLAGGVGTAWAW